MLRRVLILACLCFLGDAGALRAQITPGEVLLGSKTQLEQLPRLAGDWLTYTQDAGALDSFGRIVVEQLSTGETHELGAGFGSDIDAWVGADGAPRVRVAWLRLADDVLSIQSATLLDGSWHTEVLLPETVWADHVRVSRELTLWSGVDGQKRTRIVAHEGLQRAFLSAPSNAFRPTILRHLDGEVSVFWDQYLEGGPHLDYEIFSSTRNLAGQWSAPVNISRAPRSTDISVSAALGPGGETWLAWRTDRGSADARVLVGQLAPNGQLLLTQPLPASSDPADLGLFGPPALRSLYEPVLRVDATGRPWLFVNQRNLLDSTGPYDKRILSSSYSGGEWTTPQLLSLNSRDDLALDVELSADSLRCVYQTNSTVRRSVDIGLIDIALGEPSLPPQLSPPGAPPAPHAPYAAPVLPEERTLQVDDQTWRLVFADLHSHTKRSPDGMGELDHALFFARDIAKIDVLGSTDHDERALHPMTDWEYQLGRRFHALFDDPEFVVMHGFEWTSNVDLLGPEHIGHRATIDSSKLYRNTDDNADELAEYYALMNAEGAIGVPHHLGKHGGATFLLHDEQVQPVTEIASIHGVYETEVHEKLVGNGVRFGVTAAGDEHGARPGRTGLAGVWIDADGPLDAQSVKTALRQRRCFAVRKHGAWMDFRVNGAPLGSALVHDGPLLVSFALREVPSNQPFTVTIVRDGQLDTPLFRRSYPAGASPAQLLALPGVEQAAYLMLRVTAGLGHAPDETLLWSTPIWIEPAPGAESASNDVELGHTAHLGFNGDLAPPGAIAPDVVLRDRAVDVGADLLQLEPSAP